MPAAKSSRSSRGVPVYRARLSRPISRGRHHSAPPEPKSTAVASPRSRRPARHQKQPGMVTVPTWVWLIIVALVSISVLVSAAMSWWWGQVSRQNINERILFVQTKKPSSEAKIYFALFSSKSSDNKQVELGADQPVMVLGGYGQYQLHALAPLLAIDNKSPEFIRAAYSWALTQLVDRVVVIPAEVELPAAGEQSLGGLLTSLLGSKQVPLRTKGELLSLVGLAWQQETLQQPLTVSAISDLQAWPTGAEETTGCSLAVINTTGQSGVASELAKLIERSRARVIRVDDSNERLLQTKLVVNPEADCHADLRDLEAVWPFQVSPSSDQAISGRYRADIVVLIGDDLAGLIAPKIAK